MGWFGKFRFRKRLESSTTQHTVPSLNDDTLPSLNDDTLPPVNEDAPQSVNDEAIPSLNYDVLYAIMCYLDKKSLVSVCLTSRMFNEVASPLLYQLSWWMVFCPSPFQVKF